MKRVIFPEPHRVQVIDEDQPRVQAGEALVNIKAVGICGSDLHTFEGKHPFISHYPVRPGHELAGIVEEVGSGVDTSLIGQTVTVEPSLVGSAGNSGRWQQGRYNIADDLQVMGFQLPGGMAEHFAVPVHRLHILPDDFSHDLGAFVEPTAVAVHTVRLSGIVSGMDVGVIGAGTIGLLVAGVAGAYGAASVHIAEIDPERQKFARSMGLEVVQELGSRSVDIVFECVGVESALRSAILACRKGAAVVIAGVFGSDATLPVKLIQDWELRLLGSLMYVGDDFREAIRLLDRGDIQIEQMITHRYPLVNAAEAFDNAAQRGRTLKVLLYP